MRFAKVIVPAVLAIGCQTESPPPGSDLESGQRPSGVPSDASEGRSGGSTTAGASPRDSSRVAAYLEGQRRVLERIVARENGFYALITRGGAQHARALVLLRVTDDSVRALAEPEVIYDFTPQRAGWLALSGGRDINAFAYTFDYATEGVVATRVLTGTDGGLAVSFADSRSTCKPADIRDFDEDGIPELVAYLESGEALQSDDCSWFCDERLEDQFGVISAWPAIYRWTGERWERSDAHYPQYYRGLADRYRRAHDWIATLPEDDPNCGGVSSELQALEARARSGPGLD